MQSSFSNIKLYYSNDSNYFVILRAIYSAKEITFLIKATKWGREELTMDLANQTIDHKPLEITSCSLIRLFCSKRRHEKSRDLLQKVSRQFLFRGNVYGKTNW